MFSAANISNLFLGWQKVLADAASNLHKLSLPLATTCIATYVAAAVTLSKDNQFFQLIGEQLYLVGLVFIVAVLLKVFAPTDAEKPTLLSSLMHLAVVAVLVISVTGLTLEIYAVARTEKAWTETNKCMKKKVAAFEDARSKTHAARDRLVACWERVQSDRFAVQLALTKREITLEAEQSLIESLASRCTRLDDAVETGLKEMNEATETNCPMPPHPKDKPN